MKKLTLILALLISLASFGQTQIVTDSYYYWMPYVSPRVHASDSVQVTATILTNGNVQGISWTQTAGPAVKINSFFSTKVGFLGQSVFWLQGLVPGTYSFTATATVNGVPLSVTDSFTVVPDIVCPVCPSPRTVTSLSITVAGVKVSIPVAGANFGFSDGGSQ